MLTVAQRAGTGDTGSCPHSSGQTHQSGSSWAESAGAEVERLKTLSEIDMEPLAARFLAFGADQVHHAGSDSAVALITRHHRVLHPSVCHAVPDNVDESDHAGPISC